MKRMYTDQHLQVESGNDIFDRGCPRQVVRREFENGKVVWFEKSVYAGEGLQKLTGDVSNQLEDKYSS